MSTLWPFVADLGLALCKRLFNYASLCPSTLLVKGAHRPRVARPGGAVHGWETEARRTETFTLVVR